MNQVRILWMMVVLSLSGMGAWVWKLKEKQQKTEVQLTHTKEVAVKQLAEKDLEKQEALVSQNEENQKLVQRINEDFEKKLDDARQQERKRTAAAFEQFSEFLDGNKKSLGYINALEDKIKSGQSINKNEAEKLAVFATGLAYLQKQYQKPFQQFSELEKYLSAKAGANVETPDMRHAFWKRLFNSEFREQEREFYRTEGERRGFQDASERFSSVYKNAQKQMASVDLDFEKSILKLNDLIAEKQQAPPDLSEFFNQARKALNTHQKLLEFEPDATKPPVEAPKP